jgi:hypothetical protein
MFDVFVNSCLSRESWNPGTCKNLKLWIPTFAGMTNKCVIRTFLETIMFQFIIFNFFY